MIPPTDWTGRRTVKRGFGFLSVFHQVQLRPGRGSMSYIRLGFRPGSSGKSRALEKDTPARRRRNRNVSNARAIWRVVSLNQRGFAAFLQDEFDQQPKPHSKRTRFVNGARSCGVGREDHHRFDRRQTRPLVRRACILDRGGVHYRGSGRIPVVRVVPRLISSLHRTVHHHLDQFRAGPAECRLEGGS
jgi:hypothetical protein